LWETGTSSSFATTSQIGSTVGSPNGEFKFTTSHELKKDTNYFWLTYDINSGATANNVVDAVIDSLKVDDTLRTPSVTSPSGSRTISPDMSYNSSTTVQASTDSVAANETDAKIVKVKVDMDGGSNALNANELHFHTDNSTTNASNDLTNAKLYYTGTT
ncbi:MAG: BNR-repeat neuraminidase N-terminal domain-containing protein, partial [Flavobacteriales bacterium]